MAKLQVIEKLMPTTAAKVAAQLDGLNAQHAELIQQIEHYESQCNVLEDADAITKATANAKAAANRATKIRAKMQEVSATLDLLQNEERAKLRADLLGAVSALRQEYLASAKTTRDVFQRLIKAKAALESAGFDRDAREINLGPHVGGNPLLVPELLATLEEGFGAKAQVAATPAPAPRQEPPTNTGRARPVSLDDDRHYRQKSRPVLREVPTEGEVMFMVHRGGLEFPAGRQLVEGDVVTMALTDAIRLTKKCVGDIISAEALAELDASDAMHSRLPAEGEK